MAGFSFALQGRPNHLRGKPMGGNVRYGAALAATPEGPYVKTPGRIFEPESPTTTQHWMFAEDPFVWFSRTAGNRYYAVARGASLAGSPARRAASPLFQSDDGLKWRAADHPEMLGAKFFFGPTARSATPGRAPRAALRRPSPAHRAVRRQPTVIGRMVAPSFNVHLPLSAESAP